MISINATLIIQVIHFLILVFILNRILFRPIMNMIEKRAQHIKDESRKLDNLEDETKELAKKWETLLRDTRKDAGYESSRIKHEAMEVAEKLINETREETASIKENAAKEIEAKLSEARKFIQEEAMSLAGSITEKIIGRRISN